MVKGCEKSVICSFGLRSVNQMNSAIMASSMTTKVVRAWAWLTHEARASCYRKQVNTTQAMLKRWEGDFTWFYKQCWSFLRIMLHVACAWGFGIIAHHEWHEIAAFLIPQLQFGTLHRTWRTKIHVANSQTTQWKVNGGKSAKIHENHWKSISPPQV